MAKFRKLETLTAIKDSGIVPVFFNSNLEIAKNVVKACYEGGIRAFEFTNRGDFAIMIFRDLSLWALKECPEMILGAGTILDAPTAALYIQMGANFIVSPSLNPEVARLCNRRGIPYTPGCGSVTEICNAQELGCDLVKVFPAGSVGGACGAACDCGLAKYGHKVVVAVDLERHRRRGFAIDGGAGPADELVTGLGRCLQGDGCAHLGSEAALAEARSRDLAHGLVISDIDCAGLRGSGLEVGRDFDVPVHGDAHGVGLAARALRQVVAPAGETIPLLAPGIHLDDGAGGITGRA